MTSTCAHCGRTYEATTRRSRYCRHACNVAASKRRKQGLSESLVVVRMSREGVYPSTEATAASRANRGTAPLELWLDAYLDDLFPDAGHDDVWGESGLYAVAEGTNYSLLDGYDMTSMSRDWLATWQRIGGRLP